MYGKITRRVRCDRWGKAARKKEESNEGIERAIYLALIILAMMFAIRVFLAAHGDWRPVFAVGICR